MMIYSNLSRGEVALSGRKEMDMVQSKKQLWRTLWHAIWEHLVEEGHLAEKGWLPGDLKSSLALKAHHHLRSVVRWMLVLAEAFTPIILTVLQNMDSKICRSPMALNVCDSSRSHHHTI